MSDFTSEVRDGMRVDWDVPIAMDDGVNGCERYRGRRGLATAGEEEAGAVRLAPGLRLGPVQGDDGRPVRVHP